MIELAPYWTTQEVVSSGVPWDRVVLSERRRAVEAVADTVMAVRCRGAGDLFEMWREVVLGLRAYTDEDRSVVEAFLEPSFGLPGHEIPGDQLQAAVAEHIWFMVEEVRVASLGGRYVSPPKAHATAPGGDGLSVVGDPPHFRLWEIKKSVSAQLSPTILDAYSQLRRSGRAYLAQMTTIGQEFGETDLRDLFARLPRAWLSGDDTAGIGVAIVANVAPRRCFSTMRTTFPRFTALDAHRGLVAAMHDLPTFAGEVRARLWTGL